MIKLRTIAVPTVAAVLALSLISCGLSKNTKQAEAQVDRFHQHWNEGDFQAVFNEAHMNFRAAQSASDLLTTMLAVKKNYGELKSSKRRSWGFNKNNGVTDIKLSYDSAYDRGSAVEEFVYRMTGDRALLLSYDIASPETAAKREAEKKAAREEKRKAEEAERKAARESRKKP
jgi:hypothetical protein